MLTVKQKKILKIVSVVITSLIVSCSTVHGEEKNKTLNNVMWGTFITGQIVSAGNMIYQQGAGYYEINPLYGEHPSRKRIYVTKIIETAGVYGLTEWFPKYKTHILTGANTVCWGFIYSDYKKGISMTVRF